MTAPFRYLVALFIVVLAGCAASPRFDDSQQALLIERAQSRWEALVDKNWSAAYAYTSPAYREVFSESLYAKRFSYMVEWELTSIEFLNYDAFAAVASVAVRVMSKPVKQTSAASVAIGSVPTRFVEQWILVDGEWWYSANL